MNKETKDQRAQILRRQIVIEEQHCATCSESPARKPSSKSCQSCVFGKELLGIGCALDQALGPRRGGRHMSNAPILTADVIAKAQENGISAKTLRIRVQQFYWPLEKAINQPVDRHKPRKGVSV